MACCGQRTVVVVTPTARAATGAPGAVKGTPMRCTAPYAGPVMWLGKYYAAGGDVLGVDPADVARLAGTGKWVVVVVEPPAPPAPEPEPPAEPQPEPEPQVIDVAATPAVTEEAQVKRRKSKKES